MNFTLYPVYWLADQVDDEPFDLRQLPFDVVENVTIEDVSARFRDNTFAVWTEQLAADIAEHLEDVRYALVHRYEPKPAVRVAEHEQTQASETLLRNLAACLRLIRPMRQHALLMRGTIREDGSFDVGGFDVPALHLLEVPEVQRLFKLRNEDTVALRTYAPEFLRAMRGQFWKFRMSVQFHELGHFQSLDWKARFLLWCSAIESIYTSHSREHQGSLVATSRIKWFLGENTSIYAPGDLPDLLDDPGITVGQVVTDLYEMRNFTAHGDRIPDPFFNTMLRHGFNGGVQKREVLLEATSFIIRATLLRVLRDHLLNHFVDADAADAYFDAQGLTRVALVAQLRAAAQRNP